MFSLLIPSKIIVQLPQPKTNKNDMTKHQYIAKYEFVGDANLHQLSFARDTVIEVTVGQQPKNGWLWGSCEKRKGWFPSWAVEHGEIVRSRDEGVNESIMGQSTTPATVPFPLLVQLPSMGAQSEANGFDPDANEIMGGNIPRQSKERGDNNGDNPFHTVQGEVSEESSKMSNRWGLFSRFRNPKINPFPFQQDRPKTPEWTPEPQIIYEGKVIRDFSQTKQRRLFQFSEN